MTEKFHVSIFKQEWNAGLAITIWEERNGRIYVAKPMDIVFKECPQGYSTEPTMRIDHFHAPEFMRAFAEALDKAGVKTESDATIAGTLKAQSYHLEDLRKMLKLGRD